MRLVRIYARGIVPRAYASLVTTDHARDIYKNTTLGQIDFLRHLTNRAAEDELFREGWQVLLNDSADMVAALRSAISLAGDIPAFVSANVWDRLQGVSAVHASQVGSSPQAYRALRCWRQRIQ
jgi:hypothetical protein